MSLFKRSKAADAPWYYKFEFQGRQFPFNTGTHIKAAAAAAAKKFRVDTIARVRAGLGVGDEFKMRTGVPSLGECEGAFAEGIARVCERPPSEGAWRAYWGHLRRVLCVAMKRDVVLSGVSVSALSGEAGERVVRDFREAWIAGFAGQGLESRRRSGDSMLRQARACFGVDAMKCYRGFSMPDLAGFLKGGGFGSKVPQHEEISQGVLADMASAADVLKGTNPRLYLAHLCHKFLGLRNNEVEALRVGWFRALRYAPERGVQWVLELREGGEFVPKAMSYGHVPLRAEVAGEIVGALRALGIDPADSGAWVIPGRTATERYDVVYREHREWIRGFLPAELFAKAGYELRRWGQQRMAAKYHSREVGQAFTRHALPMDAGRFYEARFYPWGELGEDVGISLDEARGHLAGGATAVRLGGLGEL